MLKTVAREGCDRPRRTASFALQSERGKETLLELVEGYANHLEHHLRFIREKRERLGMD